MVEERNEIRKVRDSRLLLWASGAQFSWRALGHGVKDEAEVFNLQLHAPLAEAAPGYVNLLAFLVCFTVLLVG